MGLGFPAHVKMMESGSMISLKIRMLRKGKLSVSCIYDQCLFFWLDFFFLLTISLTVISDKMNFHLLLLGVMCGSDLDASVTQRSLVFESCIMFKSGLEYCLDLPPEHFRFTCYIDR
jgi:hypothetical protein